MKLEFTKEGLLPDELYERIRGRPTKYRREPPKPVGERPATDNQPSKGQAPAYYFMVSGFAPELISGVAFRLAKHFDTRDKKLLKCPHCGKVFGSIDRDVSVELRCYAQASPVSLHNFAWCKSCHAKVGVIHRSA
jgi:hypothetical protein